MSNPTSPAPPVDLRHVTSAGLLTPPKEKPASRTSTLLTSTSASGVKAGTRSPNSIPSSPTSVHSSSSAIFERDIEPLPLPLPPSPPHQAGAASSTVSSPPTAHDPHHTARAHLSDDTVPAVLDSAAALLAEPSLPEEHVAVVAPANMHRGSGVGSPASLASRSPSPQRALLLSVPSQSQASQTSPTQAQGPPASPSAPQMRPTISTSSSTGTGPLPPGGFPGEVSTPTSAYYSVADDASGGSSPTTTTLERAPSLPSPTAQQPRAADVLPGMTLVPGGMGGVAIPPSPTAKRLSFMSYSDLLASTPASTLPLASLTAGASNADPPPHIPVVSGFGAGSDAASVHSVGGSVIGGTVRGRPGGVASNRDSVMMLDDVGGEWEREGLGRGLEERLEGLMSEGKA